ncbi:MAG: NosD domain-containing protein [Candidatus Bipolaricaulaceae bacterium]
MRIVSIVGVLVGLAFIGWAEMRPHPPLLLRGEAELWGVAKGRGTAAEPYVIENLRIDAAGEPFGLLLENIGRPLILRNLEIYGASVAALRLHNVHLVRVENVILRGSATGLLLHRGEKVVVQNAIIVECADGVRAMFSRALEFAGLRVTKCATGLWFQGVQDSTLTDSEIAACGVGLLLELGSGNNLIVGNAFRYNHVHARSEGKNAFDDGRRGNFWEGFEAEDKNRDGILDAPYFIGPDSDRFPLASPPRS